MTNSTLQNDYLERLKIEKIPVSIYLINGIKLQGCITNFDDISIALDNTVVQLVFKHAVSSIVPNHTPNTFGRSAT